MGAQHYGNGGGAVIAAGLCMMGGCFAQDEFSGVVDSYWPAECVAVPSYTLSSSIAIFEHDNIPAGVDFRDCYAYTCQKWMAGTISLFFVLQNDKTVYNCYGDGTNFFIAVNNKEAVRTLLGGTPKKIVYHCSAAGASCPTLRLNTGAASWDSSQTGSRLRLLDARAGKKDFYVAYGQWGWKWYLLPMRSAKQESAVFDIEMKTLVEL